VELDFTKFQKAVNKQMEKMVKGDLFRAETTKEGLWDTYLGSFPEGTNPMYKERTEHDCQCCKHFIRACGNMAAIKNGKLISIWDIKVSEDAYQVVADAMAEYVKSKAVTSPFYRTEATLGVQETLSQTENGDVLKWAHFHFKLPNKFVLNKDDIGPKVSEEVSTVQVFSRGLETIDMDAVDTVLELISQNSIYRGEEHLANVKAFAEQKKKYSKLNSTMKHHLFAWEMAKKLGPITRIRNSAIGTLLVDLSEGKELDIAVRAFEKMVAPENYKRPKALVTKGMIKKAQDKVKDLGLESALPRRYATINDITVNNILFADRSAKEEMDVFDELAAEVPDKPRKLKKVEEVSIDTFMNDILPKAPQIEMQLEGRHESNLVSLVAPVNEDVERLFKWKNNFSWAYNGDIADSSIRENVKSAGGSVTGVLRFSIQWNDGNQYNANDLDAHCIDSSRVQIFFGNMKNPRTGGVLDIDVTHPAHNVPAVENITWPVLRNMDAGTYQFYVHNYAQRGGTDGFKAEIEFNGEIHRFEYTKAIRGGQKIKVADVTLSEDGKFTIKPHLDSTTATKDIWDVSTNRFHKVRVIMNSPNHWDGEETGNRHWFFMLEDCLNPVKARGFFNEFLKNDLTEHRKVFEVLGSKMRTAESDKQLSGLGFSSTQRNDVLVRVTGKSARVVKVKF